jgi:hypothetical protein
MNLRRRRSGEAEEAPRGAPGEAPRTTSVAGASGAGAVAGERQGAGERPLARERATAPEANRRERRRFRARDMGASAVGTVGSGVMLLARAVMTLATLIAILIGLAIILVDVGANGHNTIVKAIHEGANFFAGAFTGLITFNGHPKRAITVDWGIAIVVYLVVGAVIAGAIARVGRGGLRYEETHRAVV